MSWELRRFLESLRREDIKTLDGVAKWIGFAAEDGLADVLIGMKVCGERIDATALIREFQAYHDDCDPGATIDDVLRLGEN